MISTTGPGISSTWDQVYRLPGRFQLAHALFLQTDAIYRVAQNSLLSPQQYYIRSAESCTFNDVNCELPYPFGIRLDFVQSH